MEGYEIALNDKLSIIAVLGPTASGKTGLAVELAQKYNGEVVSCDSMQIYKKMDIGTAKPTIAEMDGVPHHLIDMLELDCEFSVSDFCRLAHEKISDIANRGRLPILAGGTGLYLDSVISGIEFGEEEKQDKALREELMKIYEDYGAQPLFERLRHLDEQEAMVIDKNNYVRLIRAIEVCELYNTTMTEYKKRNTVTSSRYNALKIGISFRDRERLYDRINQRVDMMLENGLIDEAKKVLSLSGKTAFQAIGYKELKAWLSGEEELEEAVDRIKRQSRRYAKRQLTWFRRDDDVNWFYWDDDKDIENIKKNIFNTVENFLKM